MNTQGKSKTRKTQQTTCMTKWANNWKRGIKTFGRPKVVAKVARRHSVKVITNRPTDKQEQDKVQQQYVQFDSQYEKESLISSETLSQLEVDVLANGKGIEALKRFNANLEKVSKRQDWEAIMEPVWAEMAFNLESFNPVFTACMLKVQCTIGSSNYDARDKCLQNLIQPLAGEYGLHEKEPLDKTHRMLFSDWYTSVTKKPLSHILDNGSLKPLAAQILFAQMMTDVSNGGGLEEPLKQASYALGYNLAVEYLANPEKTWLLDSFKVFSKNALEMGGQNVDWKFLEIHALGEEEHAEIGHNAVTLFVPESHSHAIHKAMQDHDRDFATYYNVLADLLDV